MHIKETHKQKRQPSEWEKIFANEAFDKALISKIHKQIIQVNIKETNNHVMYRVTPIFEGNNLVASGAVMEAWSVEDVIINGCWILSNAFSASIFISYPFTQPWSFQCLLLDLEHQKFMAPAYSVFCHSILFLILGDMYHIFEIRHIYFVLF